MREKTDAAHRQFPTRPQPPLAQFTEALDAQLPLITSVPGYRFRRRLDQLPFQVRWSMETHHRTPGRSYTSSAAPLPRNRSGSPQAAEDPLIGRIMVPLDGSDLAERAIPHVAALASAFGSTVVLVSVIQPPSDRTTSFDAVEWRLGRASQQIYLDALARKLEAAGIRTEVEIAEGRASEQILRVAARHRADLIVACSHGQGGVTDFHLSGTASKVLRAAECSVFVARARWPGTSEGATTRYSRVLVPVDCTPRSQWATRLAGVLAKAQGAELVLATVIVRPEMLGDALARAEARPVADRLQALNRRVAQKYLSELKAGLVEAGVTVLERIVDGDHVGLTLARLADADDCSLIIMSAHGDVPETGWPFGSVPNLLLEHASKPVLVLQDVAWKKSGFSSRTANEPGSLPRRWT